MDFIVSRTGFCPHCKKASRPLEGNLFILHGTTTQSYAVHECEFNAPFLKLGFSPFLFFKLGVEELPSGMYVRFRRVCGIIGCGLDASTIKSPKREMLTFAKQSFYDSNNKLQEYMVYYYVQRWQKTIMSVNDWNSMVTRFKDESYWLSDRPE